MPVTSDDQSTEGCSCEHLVALTVPDDFEGLHRATVDLLAKLHPDCRVLLYDEVYQENADSNELLASAGHSRPAPSDYRHTVTRVIEDDRTREPLATLLICSEAPVESHSQLGCVIQVYKNQYHHIRQATSDKLTGLMNRDLLDFHIQCIYEELQRGERRDKDKHPECALAFIDIDNFKRINDEHGHLMGDEVLLLISQLMNKTFRDEDLLFRFGGEEFIVILRNCDRDTACTVLERFRSKIAEYDFPFVEQITVSIGFAMIEPIVNYDILISRADKALYYVKEHGKNGCGSYEALVKDERIPEHSLSESDVELF